MRKIYIVLTYTGSFPSRLIKILTRKEFSHVSIAFDKNLDEMYSFSRIYTYNPFWAGFMHEELNGGAFKRFRNTRAIIYSLDVNEEQFNVAKRLIKSMKNQNKVKSYKYNILGAFAAAINLKIERKGYFYCSEFVRYVLDECNIENNLPVIAKPDDFNYLENTRIVYKGLLRNFNS